MAVQLIGPYFVWIFDSMGHVEPHKAEAGRLH